MDEHLNLTRFSMAALERSFTLNKKDIGADARLRKFGMEFRIRSYDVEGVGHLCTMRMMALGGLMKMETIVIAPTGKDAPLFNADWVWAFGKETQMAELYDTQLAPWPEENQEEFMRIKMRDADLPNAETEEQEHWYDSLLYPCSAHKSGRLITGRLNAMAQAYIGIYCAQLPDAADCDPDQKSAKVRDFAQKLISNGGPAVNMLTKLFGAATAKRVIMTHMYSGEVD